MTLIAYSFASSLVLLHPFIHSLTHSVFIEMLCYSISSTRCWKESQSLRTIGSCGKTDQKMSKLWCITKGAWVMLMVKNLPANAGDIRDTGLISGSGRSREGGHGNTSILAWRIPWTEEPTFHGVTQSRTRLKRLNICTRAGNYRVYLTQLGGPSNAS